MGLILFKLEDVGDILFRLFESGISYSIESDCKNISYEIGDANGAFNGFVDEVESKSISYTISRVARAAAEEYPDSSFAVWYRGLIPSDSNQPIRTALFEVKGKMLYYEYTIDATSPNLTFKNERYCWGDGKTAEFDTKSQKGHNAKGILEFSKTT